MEARPRRPAAGHDGDDRFRLVVEAAPNAMVVIDEKGLIAMVNAQAERVFGYARSELLGSLVETLVPARFRDGHSGLRAAFFADPSTRPMGAGRDLYGRRKNGEEFPIESASTRSRRPKATMVFRRSSTSRSARPRKPRFAKASTGRGRSPRSSNRPTTRSSATAWTASSRVGTNRPNAFSAIRPPK